MSCLLVGEKMSGKVYPQAAFYRFRIAKSKKREKIIMSAEKEKERNFCNKVVESFALYQINPA